MVKILLSTTWLMFVRFNAFLHISVYYSGHNHSVNCVSWSHSGSRLLTSSDDRSAAVWVKGQSEPVLKFKGVERSISADGSKNFLVGL